MGFPRISRWENCTPLVMRWRDDQLTPIVEQLAPRLPDGLTDQMQLAIASVARSIVVDHLSGGRGLRYPRGKEPYRRPKRYRDGDRRFTSHYVINAMNILQGAGLIDHDLGIRCPRTKGWQSVASATDGLLGLLEPLVDVAEPRGIAEVVAMIVLRNGDKVEIDFEDTVVTLKMEQQQGLINDKLSQLELRHRGQRLCIPPVSRIFSLTFERGGRLYCRGNSYQNMPAAHRRDITFVVDGVPRPAVEIDYCSLHINMAYTEAGSRVPPGDPYTINGFDRPLVKLAVNVLFNASTPQSAISAIAEHLREEKGLNTTQSYFRAKKVVRAIRRKHYRIRGFFGSDCGARFQRWDSDIAVEVLLEMIERTGRCPLPMHDSFLVPDIDAELLAQTMAEVAGRYGLRLDLKVSAGGDSWVLPAPPLPASPYSTMEVTTPELRGWGSYVLWQNAPVVAYRAINDLSSTAVGTFAPIYRPQCHGPPDHRGPPECFRCQNRRLTLLI